MSRTHDVVVIGAGFSGMYLLHRLRDELNLDVHVFERGTGVGGTWYWSRYPGARCDVESMYYSYSFSSELEEEWQWTERYPAQPELLAYAEHVADRFDLRRDISFNTEVKSAVFDESADAWTITLSDGAEVTARFLVTAVGCLSTTNLPDFPGLDTYRGKTYHTGRWPHEPVDFSGQRVAVIGTGSSAIQSIPLIAAQAAQLTIFQRTPNFSIPAHNHDLTDERRDEISKHLVTWREEARHSAGGMQFRPGLGNAADHTEEERRAELDARWAEGGLSFAGAFADSGVNLDANRIVAEYVHERIREIVKDATTAELLSPKDFPIGTKRLCIDTDYYATYNRDNVSLVSIKETPIERFTETGFVVGGKEYEFDAVVFATGYDAMTGALTSIDIRGREGRSLRDAWAEGPRTYLGLGIHGFPNMFTITGPGSPSVLSNMLVSIEQHVDWITDLLQHAYAEDVQYIEADLDAQNEWVDHVNEVASRTLMPTAASWYMGANIPGKPRVFMPYIGGVGTYRKICDEVAAADYRGFVLRTAQPA